MVVLLISSAVIVRRWENLDTPVVIRYLFIFTMVVLAVFHSTVIMKKLRIIRESTPGFSDLPDTDPKRIEFKQWHKKSVIVSMLILLSGLGALFLS